MIPTSLPMPSVHFSAIKKTQPAADAPKPDKLDVNNPAVKELAQALRSGDITPGETNTLTGHGKGDIAFQVISTTAIAIEINDIFGRKVNVSFNPFNGQILDATRNVGGDEGAVAELNKLFTGK